MKPVFYIVATLMIVVALLLLLWPLLRHGRRQGHSRGVFALALGIALALPLAAAGLYFQVGTPAALDGVAQDQATMNIDQAIAKLRAHLAEHPGDAQGWLLMAQTATAMQQPDEARQAYARVLKLAPNDTAAMVGWAEADATARTDHRIQGHARELLEQAVKLEPDNQRGLWLLGISQFQAGQFADAAATWRILQPQLAPGSKVAQSVAEQIALADQRAGNGPAPAEPAATASRAPGITVEVSLVPALQNRLKSGDTLFVYARAPSGPPIPLAVARMDAARLPTRVVLTDAMGMLPQMKLSAAGRVFVGARISHSGQATAQAGDLEGDAGVVAVGSTTPVRLVIDTIHH